jgi:hypothetical protein
MSDDNSKKLIAHINAQLAKRFGHENCKWVMPDELDERFYITNGVVHGGQVLVELRNRVYITGSQMVHIDHAASLEEALALQSIKGHVAVIDVDDALNATAIVSPHHGSKTPPESCAEVAAHREALVRRLAMPPGFWMSRIRPRRVLLLAEDGGTRVRGNNRRLPLRDDRSGDPRQDHG